MWKKFVQELSDELSKELPRELKEAHADLDRKIRQGVEGVLSNFKFVKYEEYELQQEVLAKTREKLEELIERVDVLEGMVTQQNKQS